MSYNNPVDTPAEQPQATATSQRALSIGLPASSCVHERRFPLTPEAVNVLVERGFDVKMEYGASATIHYTDNQYARAGASVVDRDETLRCDIVIHLATLNRHDIKKMRRGAMLLTLLNVNDYKEESVRELLDRGIMAIALDLIEDGKGNTPFFDILSEIDGRASIAIASSLLADSIHGKGILLGGVSGIVPCEVTILGSGIAACAAACSATGLGAMVRMFDNDVYRLRAATRELGSSIIGSALHPNVLQNALRSADVVIATESGCRYEIDAEMVGVMKRRVVTFDLSGTHGKVFPSLPTVDLADATPSDSASATASRVCYINAGSAVPRTAAMALSNTLITMFDDISACDGTNNVLKLLPGIRSAVYTFLGKIVNARLASKMGMRHVDINIFLSLS